MIVLSLCKRRHPHSRLPPDGACIRVPVVDIGGDIGKERFADLIGRPVKDNKIDQHLIFQQEGPNGLDRHAERLILGIAVNAGGYERKRDGTAMPPSGKRKRRAVAGSKDILFAVPSVHPMRPDGVNDVFTGQPVSPRELCISRRTSAKRRALPQQLASGSAVDRSIHAETIRTEQRLVRGVDDGVHPHSGDIVSDDLKRHFSFSLPPFLIISYQKHTGKSSS